MKNVSNIRFFSSTSRFKIPNRRGISLAGNWLTFDSSKKHEIIDRNHNHEKFISKQKNEWRSKQVWFSTSSIRRENSLSSSGDKYDINATGYQSWDPSIPVLIRMEKEGPASYPPKLVQTFLREVVEKNGEKVVIKYKNELNEIKDITYNEYFEIIKAAAKGFIALGLEETHAFAIMAGNCPEWFSAQYAAIFAGGIPCGIYPTSSSEIASYICGNASADILMVDNLEMLVKIIDGRGSISNAFPGVKQVILIDANDKDIIKAKNFGSVISWNQVLELGNEKSDHELDIREKNTAVNKACMYMYTSGTTGSPKGAMLSHDNVTWSTKICTEHYQWNGETHLSYLPMCHVAPLMIDGYIIPCCGGTAFIADKNALKGTLIDNLKEARPNKFLGVPRVWEKIKERMEEAESKASPLKKAIMQWAKNAASHRQKMILEGKANHQDKGSLNYQLANKLVLSKIYSALGLENTLSAHTSRTCGSAPTSQATKDYFTSLGLFLSDVYGCTEATGPQTTCLELPHRNKDSTVGQSFIGVKNRILSPDPTSGEGEVIVSSRAVFMGYVKEEEKTKESFTDDHWFKTGDIGTMDEEGFFKVTGRIKELIITEGGKNIAPIPIESRIKENLSPIISQAIVIGDKQKYLTCLLTIKVEIDPITSIPSENLDSSARDWCKRRLKEQSLEENVKIPNTIAEFKNHQHSDLFMKGIQKGIDEANAKADFRAAEVKKFCVLPNEFSIGGGEYGPTLKLRRHIIGAKYKTEIDRMYSK